MKENCYLFFETLGNRLKIDIITGLKEEPLSVNELSEKLGQERSKVSHALISLSDCGFVKVKKSGRRRIYSLNMDTIMPLLDIVEKHVKKYCKACKQQKRIR